jgi:secreted trypsin-like serine protease
MKNGNTALLLACALGMLSTVVEAEEIEITPYIVNGTPISVSNYQYMARLLYESNNSLYALCGASLINNRYVLTAAHCVDESAYKDDLYIGIDGDRDQDFVLSPRYPVKYIYYPDNYDGIVANGLHHDVAVLELEYDIPSIGSEHYVDRAYTADVVAYRQAAESFTVIGYGNTASGVNANDWLQQTSVSYVTQAVCQTQWSSVTSSQICTNGVVNGGSGLKNASCQGDSGGPLLWYDPNSTLTKQIGIVSYGPVTCGDPGTITQAVFTEVADYNGWIQRVLNGNETPKFSHYSGISTGSSSGSGLGFWFLSVLLLSYVIRRRTAPSIS